VRRTVERHRTRDALQLDRAQPLEPDLGTFDLPDGLLARQDLSRLRLSCDAGGDVDGPPVHIAVLKDDGPAWMPMCVGGSSAPGALSAISSPARTAVVAS
jgi:hypothetical protein